MNLNMRLGILDHSGVMSDDRGPVYEANMILMQMFGGLPRIPLEELFARSCGPTAAHSMRDAFGLDVDIDEVNQMFNQIIPILKTRKDDPVLPVMYPNVPEYLRELKDLGLKLAVVSTHPQGELDAELFEYGINNLFEIVSGDPTPKPQRIKGVCTKLEIPKENTFFLGDMTADLYAAKEAGVTGIGITTGYHSREKLEATGIAEYVVDSLAEVSDLLR